MLIRRDALLHIGLFDKGLHRCQDLDLLVRLGAAGYRGAKVNAPTFVYREHAGPRGGGRHTYLLTNFSEFSRIPQASLSQSQKKSTSGPLFDSCRRRIRAEQRRRAQTCRTASTRLRHARKAL